MTPSPSSVRLQRALSEAAPGAWDYDIASNELFVSDAARAICGFDQSRRVTVQDFTDAVIPEDREKVVDGEARFLTGHGIRYRIRHPGRGVRWIKARVARHADPDDALRIIGYTGTIEDVTDEMDAAHALIESEERLRFAVEAGKMAIWEIDLETGVVTITPELNAMFGFPRNYKPSLAELRSRYAPGELEKVGRFGASWEVVKELVAGGQLAPRSIGETGKDDDRTQVSAELSIIVPPNTTKHLLYRAQYVYSLQGRPKITGFLVDITDKRDAEDQLGVVARELRHRVKNSFTVMQALARQIFNQDIDKHTALQSYIGRLQALSLANDIVLDTEADTANIHAIAERLTAPYRELRGDSIVLSGPEVEIRGAAVTGLSMVLHELCTNALKYGALSRPEGQVLVKWVENGEGGISLEWLEQGGPEIRGPTRDGFGTRLLTRIVRDALSGSIGLQYRPTGLRCLISTGALSRP